MMISTNILKEKLWIRKTNLISWESRELSTKKILSRSALTAIPPRVPPSATSSNFSRAVHECTVSSSLFSLFQLPEQRPLVDHNRSTPGTTSSFNIFEWSSPVGSFYPKRLSAWEEAGPKHKQLFRMAWIVRSIQKCHRPDCTHACFQVNLFQNDGHRENKNCNADFA